MTTKNLTINSVLPYSLLDTLAKLWVDLWCNVELHADDECANIAGTAIALAGESNWLDALNKAMAEAGIIDFPIQE